MRMTECFFQAINSLKTHKLRSILTMLGIVMGVFSVITIMAIGNAAQAYMDSQFEKIGANYISVKHNSKELVETDWLTAGDMEIIKKAIPEIKNIAVDIQAQNGEVKVGVKTRDVMCMGGSAQFASFSVGEIAIGRHINDIDISTNAKVALVDEYFAKNYFNKLDVIGEYMVVRNKSGQSMSVRIIGVLKGDNLWSNLTNNDSFPAVLYMPITTVEELFDIKKVDEIMISVAERENLKVIGERVIKVLEFKHDNSNKYMVSTSAEIQKSVTNILNGASLVLLCIAIITLVVGGVGIVNILLVSVTERIREIGIRKALGAKKQDIVMQFLIEAILMTGFSGLIGIILGTSLGYAISKVMRISPIVDVNIIAFSLLGCIVLGLIFGVYPAICAADLDPIESLRNE